MESTNGTTPLAGTAAAATARWSDSDWPTMKQRNGVQHSVARLLDALAPERAPARVGAPAPALQRLRSPRGCILQANGRALTVSWFPPVAADPTLGELQVITWRGIVSRPGSAGRAAGGAVAVWRAVLRPVEIAPDAWAWRAGDDTILDSAALAAHCESILVEGGTLAPV
jgi:hypothetical protein